MDKLPKIFRICLNIYNKILVNNNFNHIMLHRSTVKHLDIVELVLISIRIFLTKEIIHFCILNNIIIKISNIIHIHNNLLVTLHNIILNKIFMDNKAICLLKLFNRIKFRKKKLRFFQVFMSKNLPYINRRFQFLVC